MRQPDSPSPAAPLAPASPLEPALDVEELRAASTLEAAVALIDARYDFARHPYFLWLAGPATTRDEFRKSQVPFRFAVEAWAQSLAAVLAHLTAPEARRAVADNLEEEHGRGNELASHKATFLQYLRALGAEPAELERPCTAGASAFNQSMLAFCLGHAAEAGAAATGIIEHLYIGISGTLARTVHERAWCAPGSQRHYEVHEQLDQTHARDLLEIARTAWPEPATRAPVALGLLLGAHWFWLLYRDLLECR
jgi:pyrroloquinoline-quinone synthase